MSGFVVVSGGMPQKNPFSMNARGVAKFMIASPYAARKVIESYAFPDKDKPKIIQPMPAKKVIYDYFRAGRDEAVLHAAIQKFGFAPFGEKAAARTRRLGARDAATRLLEIGESLAFADVMSRKLVIDIHGLPVRATVDFYGKMPSGKVVAVIFNATAEAAKVPASLKFIAEVECEIAWKATRQQLPETSEVHYIDIVSGNVVRVHKQSLKSSWRNIETTADNILLAYDALVARRNRERRDHDAT